ncbi:MAG TPA: hypothetical protein PKY05_17640, partial [Fibrobacteria bacterium]|nr:hypothetical protein [Fibrobacteria bacterium]
MIALFVAIGSLCGSPVAADTALSDTTASATSFSPELARSHGWVAVGGFPYYGYDPEVGDGWAGRVDLSLREGRWLVQADVQILSHDLPDPSGASVIAQAGWLPFRSRRLPDIWLTTGAWWSSRLEGKVEGDRDRLGPTAGFQTILPLVGMDHGEVRFSMAYSPLEG